ncbi:cytochrome P450 18a1-like [Macrobrachium nipponense]|uniref:cytochrome P450 18a1-like n=1 Tax=Macrobrachium nipponense TaxID=159736 RepID=UPI0030C8CAEB
MIGLVHLIQRWLCRAGEVLLRHYLAYVLIFVTVLLSTRYVLGGRGRLLPPGPWGLPIIGFLPFMSNEVHKMFFRLAKKYGQVYRIQVGEKLFVILTDPKVIKEAFRREEFNVRPSTALYDMFEGYGLVNTSGLIWKDQRRFIHERMRAFGMKTTGPGREQMQDTIMVEVENLLQCLATGEGKPMEVAELFSNATTNVICSFLMSLRFRPNFANFPSFKRLLALQDEGFKLFLKCDIANYVPFFKYMPSVRRNFRRLIACRDESVEMIQDIISQRRKTFDPEHIRDILDSYLLEEYRAKKEGRILFEGRDFDRQLVQVMNDMFSAGQETVKTCLLWSLVFLLNHPHVASKVQAELDSIVGRSRMPTLDDQQHMPYTEATICEVLRRSSIVPLGTSHATSRETTLGEYTIPKGATVIPLLYACHMNPQYWTDPEEFNPLRFIDAEGNVKKPEHFLPFGVGRRMCLGHVLAKSQLFLYFTSILHVFNISCPENEPLPSMEGDLGTTLTPKPFKICFIPREVSKIVNLDMRPHDLRTAGL